MEGVWRDLLACAGLDHPRKPQVRREIDRAFREYGLPRAIRTDNGPPFASVGLGGLTKLSIWWVKLGITPERIEPGHPEQNGRLERLDRTLKEETANPPRASQRSQQRAFDTFRDSYNEQRPHEALDRRSPSHVNRPSYREYPRRARSPEHGSRVTVSRRGRTVRSSGTEGWST